MKKITIVLLVSMIMLLTGCAGSGVSEQADKETALIPNEMTPNAVTQNPYMADSENSVHNDSYSSDVTNAVLPLGIDSNMDISVEIQNPQAPSAAFYDEYGAMITPFNGGVAIADMEGDTITRSGMFVPAQHDGQQYRVQISYSFVDSDGNIVLPTSHGHVIVLQTRDENGDILPIFKKILDVDISGQASKALGSDIDNNLLSIVYDYEGNLWFVTGGFRIIPENNAAGYMGYISREYIDKATAGEDLDAKEHIYFHKFSDGEAAENGISSGEQGAVILTNKACYMINANNGVDVRWSTEYDSVPKYAKKDSEYTGIGLAYGSGTTPTLTKDLVLFTDNLDPINLIAVSMETGETVATIPVLDQMGDEPVSVENSIMVYSGDNERTSVLVCNWFGAGNAGLSDPDADSSVQSYDNLYDPNWLAEGNKYIAPGVERVDIVKNGSSYSAEKVWLREDIRDTSMIKLSTATGYLYGYWQNLDTGMWCYEVLDFETGETIYELPVSSLPEYNNVAVGMIPDVKGNALYCPTNNMEMVCWHDSFVYLPETPAIKIDPYDMERTYLTDNEFREMSDSSLTPASYLMKANINHLTDETTIAFKLNGVRGKVSDQHLFYEGTDGKLHKYEGDWSIVSDSSWIKEKDMVEIRLKIKDGSITDLSEQQNAVKISVILATE